MARNGSGTYSLPQAAFVSGTVISSSAMNSNLSDVASALTDSLAKDGQTTPTANLPLGGFKLTGLGVGSAATDSAHLGQVQAQAYIWCGTAGGTADALTLTPSPAITAYAAGQCFRFIASASPNTGATTVAVSGLTTKAVQNDGSALAASDIAASKMYEIIYDGTAFQVRRVRIGGTGSGDLLAANNLSDVANAATAATNLGLGTGNSPQFTAVNIGHASDTTITRVSAGVAAVEGATIATLSTAQTFTKPQVADTSALTHNTAWDATAIQHATVTVNGSSFTIANPSAQTNKAYYAIYVSYTTTHSISWGANFKGVSAITPSATAGKHDVFFFRSDGTNLECVGYKLDIGA